ncbi:hypothetical protein D3C72_1988460 [compost metagenome]
MPMTVVMVRLRPRVTWMTIMATKGAIRTAPNWLAVRTSVTQADTMTRIMTVRNVREGASTRMPKSQGAERTVAVTTSGTASRWAARTRAT